MDPKKNTMLLLLADMNAHVGSRVTEFIGSHAAQQEDAAGELFIDGWRATTWLHSTLLVGLLTRGQAHEVTNTGCITLHAMWTSKIMPKT